MTITEALDSYEADLVGLGANVYNARRVRAHLPPHLVQQPVSTITTKQLRGWRNALIKGGMLSATINRLMKPPWAAFTLAGTLDPRVAANTQAWRVGLAELPNATTARDAVLSEKQVMAVVAATYLKCANWHRLDGR